MPNEIIGMREALFIKKNREKWERYEHVPSEDPDDQAERFITLLDDLAYSRTFYPQSKVTKWINNIAASIYLQIYKNRREKYHRLLTFWTKEVPLLYYKYRNTLSFAFVFFVLCMGMGIVSSMNDDFFVKGILGEGYVAMTEENIEKGDPFGVYRDEDKFTMFVSIALNNIKVSFYAFVGGIVFGIGTLYIMFFNGVMVGAFEYLFFAKGVGWSSIMVIWIHGTIEIASIIIGGCSGFIIAGGILFPGTYHRFVAFKNAIKDALKIILSLVPFFLAAALLESYVTYQMSNTFSKAADGGLPVWAGVLILLTSLGLMVGYFIVYPAIVARNYAKKNKQFLNLYSPLIYNIE